MWHAFHINEELFSSFKLGVGAGNFEKKKQFLHYEVDFQKKVTNKHGDGINIL